jgi:hypothetical protein
LATSGIATALITAGATLLGVLIGAVLGAATDFQLARRRERADGRAGARLVQEDLREAADAIANCRRIGHWLGPVSPATDAWNNFRPVLASVLDEAAWRRVVSAMGALRSADGYAGWLDASSSGEPPSLDAAIRVALDTAASEVRLAYKALADLAGVRPEDELAKPAPWDDWPDKGDA